MAESDLPLPPMADLTVPLAKAAAVIAAGQLGVFEALSHAPATPAQLAERLAVEEVGITRLAELLCTVGYLERSGSTYANGAIPRTWLTSSSLVDFTPLAFWGAEVWQFLGDLADTVRRGGPAQNMYQHMTEQPEVGRIFARYMKASAQLAAPAAAGSVDIPDGHARLLDLGGSHGLNSIAFCRLHPDLAATVFDLPVALAEAEQTIASEQMADRVTMQPGDYFTDDIGHDWDVILCFDLIHNHHAEQNRQLIAKIGAALRPGGIVVIYDQIRSEPPDPFHAAFGLLMFNQNGTRTYGFDELAGWLDEAGFDTPQRRDLPPGPSSVVTAVRTK